MDSCAAFTGGGAFTMNSYVHSQEEEPSLWIAMQHSQEEESSLWIAMWHPKEAFTTAIWHP